MTSKITFEGTLCLCDQGCHTPKVYVFQIFCTLRVPGRLGTNYIEISLCIFKWTHFAQTESNWENFDPTGKELVHSIAL